MSKKRILILATGDKKGGGSGAQEMKEYSLTDPPGLDADIVGFVSNHEFGGVSKHAKAFNPEVPFKFWDGPFNKEGYQRLVAEFNPDLVMCSGFLKKVVGIDPRIVLNIHPALTPNDGTHGEFGGQGMYGRFVHEAVIKAFHEGRVTQSGITIHFVVTGYDCGPVVWQKAVHIREDDTPKTLANRVNQVERAWQSDVVNLIINGLVRLIEIDEKLEVVADKSLKGFPGLMATAWTG